MANNHWYARYVGDYAKDTAHLSLMEHGAFTLLLDWYYSTGKPLPANWVQMHRICKAVALEEQEAVQSVVAQFFTETPDGWRNDRADDELSKRAEISEKRRNAQAIREKKRAQTALQVECKNSANAHTTTTTTTIDISKDISIGGGEVTKHQENENDTVTRIEKPASKKGTKLIEWFQANGPSDGKIPPDWIEWVDRKYGWDDETIGHIAERFWRYFTGPDAKEPRKKDWKRAFQTWCDRDLGTAQAFIRSRAGAGGSQGKGYSVAVADSTKQALSLIDAGAGASGDYVPDFADKAAE